MHCVCCCLQADIILMCANAKVYNHPNTKPHKEADVLFKYSMKYVSDRGLCAARVRLLLTNTHVTGWCLSSSDWAVC